MTEALEVRATEVGTGPDSFVAELLVSTGQTVEQGAQLLAIETAKSVVEVFAPAAGRVVEVLVGLNASVVEGDLLVVLERIHAAAPPNLPKPSASGVETQPDARASSEFHASPWIRSLAYERGIPLELVHGTGPHGRILEEDLERYVSVSPATASSPAPERSLAGGTSPLAQGSTETRPLSRLQRSVGRNLSANWARIPHVTQFDEFDVSELEAFRVALNHERHEEGPKLSLLPFVIKAAACALTLFPEFNSELSEDQLLLKRDIHVGFAVDTADGVRVPVIRHADRLPLLETARQIARLAERARTNELAPTELGSGSFTISNLGGAGGTAFTPIINAPEVAILGISRTELKPKWNGNAFVPRLMLPLSLSYDHRVINGVAGARFTAYLGSVLSDLRRALL